MISITRKPNTLLYQKGRGAQLNTHNYFNKTSYEALITDDLKDELMASPKTEIIYTHAKTAINKVESKDLGFNYSINPYQGCEHGCVYCYARNSHEYWGYSAGIDFEQKIIVKRNLIAALEKQFSQKSWQAKPIMLSGNTDCYQPIEREMQLTRKILQTCLKFKHPVAVITKNALIKRDLDVLKLLAEQNLVHVMISLTGNDETLKRALEPRTSSYFQRLETIKLLADNGIPVGVMLAPIIPGLNSSDIPEMLLKAGMAGATSAGMTLVRLNGAVEKIFKDWLTKNFPDRADKVWSQICETHGGKVSDSRIGVRMRGEGKLAESIHHLFKLSKQKFIKSTNFEFNCDAFDYRAAKSQLSLF